jgi:predicted enzyme related to lactoylglutathione lyase
MDLDTHDLEAGSRFYSGLFGWEYEDTGEQFGHYQLISNDGALVGGAMDISGFPGPDGNPLPNTWTVYLTVDSVDARLEKALAAGATSPTPPMDIGTRGRMVLFTDPTGARIGLWEPKDLEGYAFTGAPGSPGWFELMTSHFDEAVAFYTDVFDVDLVPMTEPMEDDSFRYVTSGAGDQAEWGLGDATGVMPEEATGWRVYFIVPSCDPAAEKVKELGGSVLDGPVDSPFGRIATIADPTGTTFQIVAVSEAVPEG